jgi:pimeloyl-ACP methyl ester carboxylesterase
MTQAAPPHTMQVNGVDLAWTEHGNGHEGTPTFLLCHGFTGSTSDFSLVVGALAGDRRVVTLDQRGHGHSTKTGTLDGYTIDQLVDDLTRFVETVSDGPVDLLGHSMGGRVVMGVVLSRPDLVSSLILMDTSAWSFLPRDVRVRAAVRKWVKAFDPAQGMPATMAPPGPEDDLIAAATPAAFRQERDAIRAGMDPYAVKALGAVLMDVSKGEESLRAQLPLITCPTTVIAGEHDHPLVDQAPELAAAVADGRLAVIEGAYHSPQLTHREPWLAAVRSHLRWADARRTER